MSKHDDDTCPHLVRASLLEAENARLKTEVDHLGECLGDAHAHNIKEQVEIEMCIERLKAEVERLRASSFVTAVPVEQYERLREAGDALAAWTLTLEHTYDHKPMDGLPFSSFLCAWHEAAKEGKQP